MATWLVLAGLISSDPRGQSAGFSNDVSPWTYLLNQTIMITRYLYLTIWPRPLVAWYGWALPLTIADVIPYALFVMFLLMLTAAALLRQPRVGFLGAWFFITLAPTSTIVPIATEMGAERRMYLPLIAQGLTTTWKHLTKSLSGDVVTVSYPDEEPNIAAPLIYRGVHRLNKDEQGRVKCVACFLCSTACPAHCIDIVAAESPWPDREKYPQSFQIDELRCIYCGMCEEACPVDAIELTSLYNLTGRSREEMIFDKEKLLSVFDATKDKEPMQSPALGGTAT